jgi:hypothetical protein
MPDRDRGLLVYFLDLEVKCALRIKVHLPWVSLATSRACDRNCLRASEVDQPAKEPDWGPSNQRGFGPLILSAWPLYPTQQERDEKPAACSIQVPDTNCTVFPCNFGIYYVLPVVLFPLFFPSACAIMP